MLLPGAQSLVVKVPRVYGLLVGRLLGCRLLVGRLLGCRLLDCRKSGGRWLRKYEGD